jgi:rare lipoprotein A
MASRAGPGQGVAADAPAVHPNPHVTKHVSRRKRPVMATEPHASPAGGHYSAVGMASWYGADFHGRRTADGETFDMNSFTAAHPTLPIPCTVRVTNLTNHRSIMVRVNDRGPYVGHRLIDVSARAAKVLGFYDHGLTKVKIDYVGHAPPKGPVGDNAIE